MKTSNIKYKIFTCSIQNYKYISFCIYLYLYKCTSARNGGKLKKEHPEWWWFTNKGRKISTIYNEALIDSQILP